MERRVTFPLGPAGGFDAARMGRVRSLLAMWLRPLSDKRGPVLLRGQLVEGDDGILYLDTVIRAKDQWDLRRRARETIAAPVERLLHQRIGDPQIGRRKPDPGEWPSGEELAGQEPHEDQGGEDEKGGRLVGDPVAAVEA